MDDKKSLAKGAGYPQEADGTLLIRVFGSPRMGEQDVVRKARVTVIGPVGRKGAEPQRTIVDKTDDSGTLELKLSPGSWLVRAEGLGVPKDEKTPEVSSECRKHVDLVLKVNLVVQTRPALDKGPQDGPRYRAGTIVTAYVDSDAVLDGFTFAWTLSGGTLLGPGAGEAIDIDTSAWRGPLVAECRMIDCDGTSLSAEASMTIIPEPVVPVTGTMNIGLRRSASFATKDLPLWAVILKSTEALSFKNYLRHMNLVLCGGLDAGTQNRLNELKANRHLPFTDSDAYRLLKVATEAFVMVNCGVALRTFDFTTDDTDLVIGRTGIADVQLEKLWSGYLEEVNGGTDLTLPYLAQVASKFPDSRATISIAKDPVAARLCLDFVNFKLSAPCFVELIWSYWHEEAMLVQSMNAVSLRFQNRRAHPGDPLASMEISPLRPLNNLLWGYIQDEQHRLTVLRRVHEYDHEYGLSLEGRAVPAFRTADSRSQFLQAFHNLLYLSSVFFQKDDNTMVLSDAFPVLNALKEVHLILSQGAHNQFGDMPVTARVEMLMQQWILARPEFGEFLPTRAMVAYPEPWMDRVDAMKKLQGWSDVNVLHFRDLGLFGEQLLLSIRYGSWTDVHDPDQAKNWLRLWRPQIQGYVHAYRAVTGADVTTEPVNSTPPSVLLARRLAQQPRLGNLLSPPCARTRGSAT